MSGKNIFLKFSQASQPKEASSGRVVGERGRNDLPPGKKGGETMTPDRHYEHKQHMSATRPLKRSSSSCGVRLSRRYDGKSLQEIPLTM